MFKHILYKLRQKAFGHSVKTLYGTAFSKSKANAVRIETELVFTCGYKNYFFNPQL